MAVAARHRPSLLPSYTPSHHFKETTGGRALVHEALAAGPLMCRAVEMHKDSRPPGADECTRLWHQLASAPPSTRKKPEEMTELDAQHVGYVLEARSPRPVCMVMKS